MSKRGGVSTDPAALAAARQTLTSLERTAAGAEAIDLAIARKADEQLAVARADEDLAAVEGEGIEKARVIAVAQLRLAEAEPLRQSKAAAEAANRYGITSSAEQYAGFAALTAGGADAERGRLLVDRAGGIRQALLAHHPDHGGSARDLADVQAFRDTQAVATR